MARVKQVKEKSLSRAFGLSWDRLAGSFGLAGLSSGKAKSLSQAGLALSLNPDRFNFLFLKSFINSNHFDSNSNLNYARLLHIKQNMGALHHTIKYATT
jgi:hypothetical protein